MRRFRVPVAILVGVVAFTLSVTLVRAPLFAALPGPLQDRFSALFVDGGSGTTALQIQAVTAAGGAITANLHDRWYGAFVDAGGGTTALQVVCLSNSCGGGGGAPTDATYITQTPNTTLTAEQPLSALATGFMKSTTTTGVVSTVAAITLTTDVTGILPVANGGLNLSAAVDDNVPIGNGTTWQSKALPSCSNATTSKLLYDTSTNAFSCGTDQGGSGAPGGSNTQVQFNDGGAFGGDAGLTYNKTTKALTQTGSGRLLVITQSGGAEVGLALNRSTLANDFTNVLYQTGGVDAWTTGLRAGDGSWYLRDEVNSLAVFKALVGGGTEFAATAKHIYLRQTNADNGWKIGGSDADGLLHIFRRGEGGSPTDNEVLTVTTAGAVNYVSTVFASLGTPANGEMVYCGDCTIANPCAGSGTGAFAKRLNSVWVCN